MTGEPNNEPAAAAIAPAAEPAAPAPVAASEPAALVADAEPSAPASEPAAPADAAKPAEAEGAKPHTDTPSLAEEAGAKPPEAEKKPEDAKPGEQVKPAETSAPVYDFKPYQLPEGFQADEPTIGKFNEVLVKPDLDPQQRGQELIDLHTAEMTKYATQVAQDQHKTFADTRAKWRDQIKADPELGGAGFNTTVTAMARARDLFVPKDQIAAYNDFCRATGAGDHPVFARLLVSLMRKFDEPAIPPQSYKPPPDIGKKPGSRGDRRSVLYDHANSEAKRS